MWGPRGCRRGGCGRRRSRIPWALGPEDPAPLRASGRSDRCLRLRLPSFLKVFGNMFVEVNHSPCGNQCGHSSETQHRIYHKIPQFPFWAETQEKRKQGLGRVCLPVSAAASLTTARSVGGEMDGERPPSTNGTVSSLQEDGRSDLRGNADGPGGRQAR